jgi:hypothetical protein
MTDKDTDKERDEILKALIRGAMAARCEEQGHIWKRVVHVRGDLECKWCGFRI